MAGGAIRGKVAAVKWAYYTAAAIEGYTVTRKPKPSRGWSLTATVIQQDEFKLAQRPLFFVAFFKGGAWRWEIQSWHREQGRIIADLGPVSTEDAYGLTTAKA